MSRRRPTRRAYGAPRTGDARRLWYAYRSVVCESHASRRAAWARHGLFPLNDAKRTCTPCPENRPVVTVLTPAYVPCVSYIKTERARVRTNAEEEILHVGSLCGKIERLYSRVYIVQSIVSGSQKQSTPQCAFMSCASFLENVGNPFACDLLPCKGNTASWRASTDSIVAFRPERVAGNPCT